MSHVLFSIYQNPGKSKRSMEIPTEIWRIFQDKKSADLKKVKVCCLDLWKMLQDFKIID